MWWVEVTNLEYLWGMRGWGVIFVSRLWGVYLKLCLYSCSIEFETERSLVLVKPNDFLTNILHMIKKTNIDKLSQDQEYDSLVEGLGNLI